MKNYNITISYENIFNYLPEYCNVAPNTESITEPNKPAIPPINIMGNCDGLIVNILDSTVYIIVKKYAKPIARPPRKLTTNPIIVTPPFVPRGTRSLVVIKNGSVLPNTLPNSLAHVSPLQHANEPIQLKI